VRKWQQSGFVSLASLTTTVLAVLSLGFPLFENILLAGHVGSYSFDTLKGIAFASLIIAIAAALITKWSHAFDGLVFLAALGSIALFYQHYIGNVDFTNPRYAAHEKIGKFIRETARDGELAFYSTEVRGQLVFSAGRNLVEKLDDDSAQAKSSPVDFAREEARRRGFVDAVIYTPSADRRSISMVRLSTQNDRVDAKSFPFQFQ